jgi:hypothetical protein
MNPYIDTWSDTEVAHSTCCWLALPQSATTSIQAGETADKGFQQQQQHDEPQDKQTFICWVEFPKPYKTCPNVECWITQVDLLCGNTVNVELSVLECTTNGARIQAKTRQGCKLVDIRAGWIAMDRNWTDHAFVGSGKCAGNGEAKPGFRRDLNDLLPGHFMRFPENLFHEPPSLMIALKSFEFGGHHSYHRVRLDECAVSKDGVWVGPNTWHDTVMHSIGMTIIAVA